MSVDFMNRWITPESVLWTAAACSFILLILVRPVTEIVVSRRLDGGMRFMKIGLYFILPLLVIFPTLVLLMGETVRGTPCGFYLLFFSLFCYYLGKSIGNEAGRASVSEFIGLDMFDSMEDVQDRLFESRQRYPDHGEVAKEIAGMAKKKAVPGYSEEDREEGVYRPRRRRASPSPSPDVLEVMVDVEEVEEQ